MTRIPFSKRLVVGAWVGLAMLVGGWGTSDPAWARKPRKYSAELVSTTGGAQVRIGRTGEWKAAKGGLRLPAGSGIKTTTSGLALRFRDGTAVSVGPSSNLQLQESMEITVGPGAPRLANRLDLKKGGLEARLAPTGGKPLLVVYSSEILSAFLRGEARVRVIPQGIMAAVDDGAARVASHGRWVSLSAGEYMNVGAPAAKPLRLAPAPVFDRTPCAPRTRKACPLAMTKGGGKATVGVGWAPVRQAGRFQIRLARNRNMQDVVTEASKPANVTSFSTQLPAGRYWLTVRSVGKDGVAGRTTGPRELRVLRLIADKGVVFDSRTATAILPPKAVVRPSNPRGLEMGAQPGTFGPLPKKIGVGVARTRRTVRLRIRGDASSELPLTLERRRLRAEVELNPKTARWPQDPVDVTIKLRDPSGRFPTRSYAPRILVEVNSKKIAAKLVRRGDTWRGRIAPQSGQGPWVVHVAVSDKTGHSLGRGFLEVVGPSDNPSATLW